MTNGEGGVNGTILLTENESPFSPISVLHYQYYKPGQIPSALTENNEAIQCIVGQTGAAAKKTNSAVEQNGFPAGQTIIPFGNAQQPSLEDYADGVDTLQFLRDL